MLGWQEIFLLLVIGLLLYGRNLPDAGRSLGRVVAQLKRSFYDFKDQLDRDGEIRDVKKAIQDTAREVKNVAKVPRAMTNPGEALRDLTHEAMASPIEDDEDASQTEDADSDGEDVTKTDAPTDSDSSDDSDSAETQTSDSQTADSHNIEDLDQRKDWIQP